MFLSERGNFSKTFGDSLERSGYGIIKSQSMMAGIIVMDTRPVRIVPSSFIFNITDALLPINASEKVSS